MIMIMGIFSVTKLERSKGANDKVKRFACMDIFRGMGQIKKKSNVETAGAGNYITVYAEANFKGNSERFEVCFIISVLIILVLWCIA